jgi:hypothetical protein
MKTLNLEVPDEVYAAFEQMAAACGRSLEALALESLAQLVPTPGPLPTPGERQAARELLRRHMGALSSGDPHSGDNERIDADLAREYANTHEED